MTIRTTAIAIIVVVVGWLGVLVGVTLISDDAPSVLVVFPSQEFLAHIPENVAILSETAYSVTLTSDDTDLARRLYQNGARLVLPAGLEGCFSRA